MASLSVFPTTIINKPVMNFSILARHSRIRWQVGKIPMVCFFNMKPNTPGAAKGSPQCLSSKNAQQGVRVAFPGNIWADRLGSFTFKQLELEAYDGQVELLKKDVEAMLMAPTSNAAEKILLIDLFCRLGVSYHFESEIENQLHKIFTSQPNFLNGNDYDLYTVSIVFRVFRQHGLKMSSDVFKRFQDENDKFKKSLINDARGMLSLFEAAQLSVHGEDILDEALSFTTAHLGPLADATSNPHFANEIFNALKHPLHKGMPRVKAREYISFYENCEAPNETLLRFAKLDFNRLQLLHRKELRDILEWWKNSNLWMKLPYARDRIVEFYFWSIGLCFEPQYARARESLAKICYVLTFLDDAHDAYGSFEELQSITDAIDRWDRGVLDQLPEDYLRHLYGAFLDLFDDLDNYAAREGRSYAVSVTRDRVKEMARAYWIQRQWIRDKYSPTFEESLEQAGLITSGVTMVTASCFLGMGEVAGIESYQWLQSEPVPAIIRAIQLIARLTNEIVTYKIDEEGGYLASPFFNYMRQYKVSEMEVIEEFRKMVSKEWKTVNEEWMKNPTALPRELLTRVVNVARLVQNNYDHVDCLTYAKQGEDYIKGMFIDPFPIN